MSDEKVLTKEIAEQFLADGDSVDLAGFTAIEDDARLLLCGICHCCRRSYRVSRASQREEGAK